MSTPQSPDDAARAAAPSDGALSDADLHALVDGQVSGAERERLLQRLQADPSDQARVAQWQAQRDQLRALHRHVLHEPVPRDLLDAAHRMNDARRQAQRWQRWGGMAASLVLAFGAGWLGHAQWPSLARPGGAPVATLAALPNFARDAAVAHAVYSPEKRHPVEVMADDQEHLVQWLSRRTGKALKVPDLRDQGFSLVGGRLLPGEAGPRAQFMFQNPSGTRVTLYIGAVAAASAAGSETAFRFTHEGPVPGFYWVDQGFGYALSGPLDRNSLMALADAVYRQL